MCAILDASVCSRVFGDDNRPAAGKGFFKWIDEGNGRLVIGGKLRYELYRNSKFRDWATTARQYGRLKSYDDDVVNDCAKTLTGLASDDSHVIALAIKSKARLLCTDDENLKIDFKNKKFIPRPKGSIFSMKLESEFTKEKRDLLQHCSCRV